MSQTRYLLQVVGSFQAPKKQGNEVVFKSYQDGTHVEAIEADISSLPESHARGYYSLDGYFLPKGNVYVLERFDTPLQEVTEVAEAVEVQDKDLMKKDTKETIEQNTNAKAVVERLKTKNKTAIRGAMFGAGAGLIYSMMKSKNKFVWIGLGATAGYMIGNMLANNDSKTK
jgi:hypothetical protein